MTGDVTDFIARNRFPGAQNWVMPAYQGESIVNLMHSLLAYFGTAHETSLAFHPEFVAQLGHKRKVLFLLLDGLGWHNLDRAIERRPIVGEVFGRARRWPLTSVFPSTTSAAVSCYLIAEPPGQTGVIGYLMYFPEYGRVFNMLGFRTPDARQEDLLSFGFVPESYIYRPNILERLQAVGVLVSAYTNKLYAGSGLSRLLYHDCYPHPYLALGDMLAAVLEQLRAPIPRFQLLYWDTLDMIAHVHGADSEAYAIELAMLARALQNEVLPLLDDDTVLIICADHGHIDGNDEEAVSLMSLDAFPKLLRVPPAGEGRSTQLFIIPSEVGHAREILESTGVVTVLEKERLLSLGLLGPLPLRVGLEAQVGDLLALPHGSRRILFDYQPRPHTAMTGRHGGLSPEEMIVPLLVWA